MTPPPKIKLSHRAEALLVRACMALFGALPPAAASNTGGFMTRAIGPWIPVSKIADKNLAAAMPELNKTARRRIIADVWENLGRTVAELAHIGELHETASGPGYRVTGWEHVAAAMAGGKPLIFFTGHIANWEVGPPAAFNRGADIGFMYRAASNPLVNDMILRLRESSFRRKVTMFPKGAPGARAAYSQLVRGKYLGILIDQKLDNGIAVPFFGRPAMTAPALAIFALKFRCPVIPVHSVREGPARLHVVFEPPVPLPDSGDKQADILALTARTTEILEGWVREKPGAWLWLHRRWPKN